MTDSNPNNEHHCDKLCFMCDRPSDVFRHVHLAPDHKGAPPAEGSIEGREVVLCIPCLAGLSNHLGSALAAYMTGGYLFDRYARRQAKRSREAQSGTPMPKYMRDVLEDIMGDAMGGADDA